jgi:UPF0716 protein FxsA
MLPRLVLLFTLLPIVEIVVLVWIAGRTSLVFVLGLVVATGLVGAWLVRHQGWRTLRRISDDLDHGIMPAESLTDGLLVLVAALLLIMPGVLSDALAIALLFPPSRKLIKAFVRRRLQVRLRRADAAPSAWNVHPDRIIDVRVVNRPEEPSRDAP